MELLAGTDDDGRRLDRILRKALRDYPLSLIHRLLRQGRILVDGKPARARDLVRAGAVIAVPGGGRTRSSPPPASRRPPELPPVIWQDSGLLILNKPGGLAVHGPDSLDTLVQAYLAKSLPLSLSFRPGPLHRLDRPTSGIIVFSASLAGARRFSALMREGGVKKRYLALVEGSVAKPALWQDELVRDRSAKKTVAAPDCRAAKTALTRVEPVAATAGYTLLLAEIGTGRTHQIRAQAAARGHPLAGDRKYGGHALPGGGFLLHAWKLEFDGHTFTAPVPDDFARRCEALNVACPADTRE